ncbi:MAG: trypsin-like peptidase domain-containing protein [Desulfosarcina sp.]|nr:trypsin-like peptidase domain-containing protein [Desulfobacterales bacterium]
MSEIAAQIKRKSIFGLWLTVLLALAVRVPGEADAKTYPRRNAVVEAVEKVSPAVVNINLEYEVRKRFSPFSEFNNPLFEEFFSDLFDPGFERRFKRNSLGSGVIIDGRRGFILTNAHVVAKTGKVNIVLNDEREYTAVIVGSDPDSDLAILRIESDDPLPSIHMGDSGDLMIGETVIAIGNPFGFSNTVTTGVISAVNRSFRSRDRVFHDFIQTDASINPGNSGGPLLNINGALIGINTAIYTGARGIGFAIPINKARRIINDLIKHGEVIEIWVGMAVQNLDNGLTLYFNLPSHAGVLVSALDIDGPAHRAGVRQGDVILSIGGRKVTSIEDYNARIRNYSAGDRLALSLWRQGQKKDVELQAQIFPLKNAPALAYELTDLKVETIARARKQFGTLRIQAESGAVVTTIRENSALARSGVKPGDIIRQIEDLPIADPSDFYRAIVRYRMKKTVVVLLQRKTQRYFITIRMGR